MTEPSGSGGVAATLTAGARRAAAAFTAPGPLGRGGYIALALFTLVVLVHATSPAVYVNDMVFDTFVPLDGGWRVLQGQQPHVDFHTPVGTLWYAAYGAAMSVFGADPTVLLWVPVLATPVCVLLALGATRERLPPIARAALAVYVGFVVVSPRHFDRDTIAHLASYNRIGWALVTVVLLAVLLTPRTRSRLVEALEIGAITASLVVLAYLKITYFALGGLGVAVAAVLLPGNRRVALISGVATWVVLIGHAAVSDLPWLYIDDIRSAMGAFDEAWAAYNAERVPGTTKVFRAVLGNGIALLAGALGLLWLSRTAGEDERKDVDRTLLAGAAMLAAIVLTTAQSHDHYCPAAIVPLALALSALGHRAGRRPLTTRDQGVVGGLAVAMLAVVVQMGWADTLAIAVHRIGGAAGLSTPASGDAGARLAGLRLGAKPDPEPKVGLVVSGAVSPEVFNKLVPTPSLAGSELQVVLDEGVRTLRSLDQADGRVLTLAFSSPFAYALGAPPPRGGASWYDPGRTFGGDSPLDPAVVLADVDVVMVPRVFELPVKWAMWEQLGPAIEADFERHDTPLWTAWVKPASTPPALPGHR